MGGIVPISSALGKKLGEIDDDDDDDSPKFQMVVVCGSNKEAQSTLQNMDWGPGVEVKIQGFVSNMDEWMNAADCLVTKAGPGTIAEASICGLPCMLFAYL
jgi:1,2-diacylglycerol 3-beta-galactosyltransferase